MGEVAAAVVVVAVAVVVGGAARPGVEVVVAVAVVVVEEGPRVVGQRAGSRAQGEWSEWKGRVDRERERAHTTFQVPVVYTVNTL